MTHVSTHLLNASTGHPATGVTVTLTDATGALLAQTTTDHDGRVNNLTDTTLSGIHRLTFDTAPYFATQTIISFYPEIIITFNITNPTAKYHVPVLLSPYSYTTYRGS